MCRPGMVGPNFVCPIVGTVGIAHPIKQFIDLNELGALIGDPDKPDKAPTYTAKFNFQTVVNGQANPQVSITPVVRGLSDASLTIGAKRTDINNLIIGLSLPLKGAKYHPYLSTGAVILGGLRLPS